MVGRRGAPVTLSPPAAAASGKKAGWGDGGLAAPGTLMVDSMPLSPSASGSGATPATATAAGGNTFDESDEYLIEAPPLDSSRGSGATSGGFEQRRGRHAAPVAAAAPADDLVIDDIDEDELAAAEAAAQSRMAPSLQAKLARFEALNDGDD